MTVDAALAAVAHLVGLGAPLAAGDIANIERRLGFQLPGDLTAFYICANGTTTHTPVENGWTRLWMAEEWKPVRSLGYGPLYSDLGHAAVIADYSLDSWWYAVSSAGAVHIVDGLRPPRIVAETFLDFVRMLVQDDEGIYPCSQKAG